ncbi:MAG: hypothetical protein AAF363_20895 [Bacteroidota bacterium]
MKKRGFKYTVSQEQIDAHRKLSVKEIFAWLEQTNKFIYQVQTPEERSRMKKIKNIERDWD